MDYDKYEKVQAVLTIQSHWKEFATAKDVPYSEVLAGPTFASSRVLRFLDYTVGELQVLLGSLLRPEEEIEIIGHVRDGYDRKPEVAVRYVRAVGKDDWLELR